MATISHLVMRDYLRRSMPSLNENKLTGLLAEVQFRQYLAAQGYQDRIAVGGWIARSVGQGQFGMRTVALFPRTITSATNLTDRVKPPLGLHTVCATFHQIGITSYWCRPALTTDDAVDQLTWSAVRLGVPTATKPVGLTQVLAGFPPRTRRYNFLQYNTDVSRIPATALGEEFAKEHLRVSIQELTMMELSDVDGFFWGNRFTYPIEIKEKTVAKDNRVGDYFGLDLGPFTKLAYYAAKRGNLHSLFVVREIDDVQLRNLVSWHYITFERLAEFASWIPQKGGTPMTGGGSSAVVRIPKAAFSPLDAAALAEL